MADNSENTTKVLYTEQPLQGPKSDILKQVRGALSRWMLQEAPKDRLANMWAEDRVLEAYSW